MRYTWCLWGLQGRVWTIAGGRVPFVCLNFYVCNGRMVLNVEIGTLLIVSLFCGEDDGLEEGFEVVVLPVEGGGKWEFTTHYLNKPQ